MDEIRHILITWIGFCLFYNYQILYSVSGTEFSI